MNAREPDHGLNSRQIQVMREILAPWSDAIVRVDLFGSRALGTYRPNSDVDIVIHGPVAKAAISRLRTLFGESSLPMRVDVAAYDDIAWPPLKDHIDAARRTLFTQADLRSPRQD